MSRLFALSVLFATLTGAACGDTFRALPVEYQQVEYIKSDGTAYVSTGINSSLTLEAQMDFAPWGETGSINLGYEANDNGDWRFFNYSGGFCFDCGGTVSRVGQ